MTYQVIARKWRPQTFEEVTGQEAVTRTLRNAVQYERLHHAYLFSGARGVGKTTTARLLAKALNCHKTDKPNPKPCSPSDADPCPSCVEIAEGRSIDVLEIDAASHTGIDDVRDTILDGINTNPARDRYKTFIIDEVHQLSKAAFNALLKTLEEPPPNVVFIMATTELHKVPDTILSRCQEFEFKTIALSKIFDRLKLIGDAEGVNITDAALKEIARAGEGSMRDAQSAFDQVISFSGEKIEVEDVVNALGIAGVDILLRAVKGIAAHNTLEAFEIVEELTKRGHDLRSFCRDLLSFFRDLLVAKVAANSEGLLDWAAINIEDLRAQADQFSEADLLRFFNSLADTEAQLRTATQPRFILEIGLVKLMEMRRVAPIEELLKKLASLDGASLSAAAAAQPAQRSSAPPTPEAPTSAPTEEKKTKFLDELLADAPFDTGPRQSAPEPKPAVEAVTQTAPETVTAPVQPPPVELAQSQPVFTQPIQAQPQPPPARPAYATATAFAPYQPSGDFVHVPDNWLDYAYERTLLRDGDDFSIILDIDLSSLVQVQKFAPPPGAVIAQPVQPATPTAPAPEKTAAKTHEKPQNGKPAYVPPAPVKKVSENSLLSRIRTAIGNGGGHSLAKALGEVSKIEAGDSEILLFLPQQSEYWKSVIEAEENIAVIAGAVKELLEKDLKPVIKIEGRDVVLVVPSKAQIDEKREKDAELWLSADNDEAIKQIISVFRGQIIDVRRTDS